MEHTESPVQHTVALRMVVPVTMNTQGESLQIYDAVIVGARVAGGVLAALLGDAGYRVLLVDRARFPSGTLSTHFFRGGGLVAVLERLGVLPEVLALGSPPLVRQYNYLDGAEQPKINPAQNPGHVGYCLSVRREALDFLLLRRACQSSSVELLELTRVRELNWEDGRVVGANLTTPDGERTVRARIVIGADGRHSFVAGAVNAPAQDESPPARAIYYCYVRNFCAPVGVLDGPEFSRLRDEIAYVFPSDESFSCIALSVNLPTFAWMRTAAEERFRERLAQHRGIASRFAAAQRTGRLLGCGPEPNHVRVPYGRGWALVGDAGMHSDPWAGMGMDMAGVHATYLAQALIQWFEGSLSEAEALASYQRQRDERDLQTYHRVVNYAKDLRQLSAA